MLIITQGSRVVLMKKKAFRKFKKMDGDAAAAKFGINSKEPFDKAKRKISEPITFEARKIGRGRPHVAIVG